MSTWLREVGAHTKDYRAERARKLIQRRVEVSVAMRRAGRSEVAIQAKGKWYDDRARGHRERIERVEACSTELVTVSCQSCGVCREMTPGCRVLPSLSFRRNMNSPRTTKSRAGCCSVE